MKKLFFLLLVVFISTVASAQVRAKVEIGTQPSVHRHYDQHRHYYHRKHYVPYRRPVYHHRRYNNRPGTRVIIKGNL
jgi:hypothetical protein